MGAAESSSKLASSVHNFTVKDARGNDVELSRYKGKWSDEFQLHGAGLLHQKNMVTKFAGQEPGSNEQITEFACTRFKAEYPIFGKVDVNGSNAAPFLKSEKGGIFGDSIKWNFTKFLADKDGHVVGRYASTSSPLSIENDVKKLLEA